VDKTVPLFAGYFVRQGASIISARNVANCRNIGQLSYVWLFPSSTLRLDLRLLCVV